MEGSGGSDSISGTADSGQGAPGGPVQNKPPTASQIQNVFYDQYGKAFADAVNKAFGKDASGVLPQTLDNAPKLDITKTQAQLGAMGGSNEPDEGRNRPNTTTYQAKDGTIFISKEAVSGGNMKSIMGTYAHELSNLLDFQVNGFKGYEQNYGNPNPKTNFGDPDTGMKVEVLMFGSPQ